jgi:hypothetical protein
LTPPHRSYSVSPPLNNVTKAWTTHAPILMHDQNETPSQL